jgi:hypothetical protein
MKTFRTGSLSRSGNTLVVAMVLCGVVGLVLLSYMELIHARTKVRARSLAWNTAIPVLEGGIEEAFTHLQDDTADLTLNGWSKAGSNATVVYQKTRTNFDNSYYTVTISNVATAPYTGPNIYSQGFVPAPLGQGYISRLVRVIVTNTPTIFSHAIAANGPVTMSGGAVVDGYDSSLGPYSVSSNRVAAGGIATNSGQNPAVNVGTADVYGQVSTGAGGTVSVGSGSVGDAAWCSSHTGIEPGWTNDDMNVSFPTNYSPVGTFPPTTITSINGSNITYLASGTNEVSSFTSSDSTKPMIVTGNAVLIVDGDFTTQGSGYVWIMPGASLILYIGGKATISGGGVVNGTGLPADFSLVGTATCNKIDYSGSAAFIGTINAPQALLNISGSAGAYGAAICNSYNSSGGSGFHYDVSLAGGGGYKLVSYREL